MVPDGALGACAAPAPFRSGGAGVHAPAGLAGRCERAVCGLLALWLCPAALAAPRLCVADVSVRAGAAEGARQVGAPGGGVAGVGPAAGALVHVDAEAVLGDVAVLAVAGGLVVLCSARAEAALNAGAGIWKRGNWSGNCFKKPPPHNNFV